MPKQAAGVLLYRLAAAGRLEVLLAHPGGPLWARKDLGAWTIPKGQFGDDEAPLAAARREFEEEMGSPPGADQFLELGTIKQPAGKIVHAFAARGDFDTATVKSNLFSMEWPPKSGRRAEFPEVDRAAWYPIDEARRKILKGQAPFLDRLLALVN
ncbi:MAG TPA: NUDIX domain-containing protein [Vicinamibacterales bacterium]|nr:NUDIX domain-containing protein [Vicinamibacterales bacterium]